MQDLTAGDEITPGTLFKRPDTGEWIEVSSESHGQLWNPDDFHPMAYPEVEA